MEELSGLVPRDDWGNAKELSESCAELVSDEGELWMLGALKARILVVDMSSMG